MLTTVVTHATGDVFPASDWNTYLRDNINYLITAGANLASAATITPTNEFHQVTGTTTIDNLTPASPVAGQQVRLLFQGALTVRNNGAGTGNIRTRAGSDRVVAANEIISFIYDGAVWREAAGAGGSAGYLQAPVKYTTLIDIVNTTAETDILQSAGYTIPAGLLGTNGCVRVRITGDHLNNPGGNQNYTLRVYFGGTQLWGDVFTFNNFTARTPFVFECTIVNLGAANINFLSGYHLYANGTAPAVGWGGTGAAAVMLASAGNSAIDTSAAKLLRVTLQEGGTSTLIETRIRQSVIEFF